jgi:hypothetical protein
VPSERSVKQAQVRHSPHLTYAAWERLHAWLMRPWIAVRVDLITRGDAHVRPEVLMGEFIPPALQASLGRCELYADIVPLQGISTTPRPFPFSRSKFSSTFCSLLRSILGQYQRPKSDN